MRSKLPGNLAQPSWGHTPKDLQFSFFSFLQTHALAWLLVTTLHALRNFSKKMEFFQTHRLSCLLIFLDFEKAFDRVRHDFMFKTLSAMGFGDTFVGRVKLLYNGATSAIRVNNLDTESFGIGNGVRQGCAVSPMLFACVAEIMANLIRSNPGVHGIPTSVGVSRKVNQYADDTVLCLKNETSWVHAQESITTFCNWSGMALNLKKTEGLWLGPKNQQPTFDHNGNPIGWNGDGKHVVSLGCPMRWSGDSTEFWNVKLRGVLMRLNNWSRLRPSLEKRILISKLCLYSCVW